MNKKLRNIIIISLIAIVLIGGIGWFMYLQNKPGQLDDFAKCLKEKDIKFYGTFWCPHCQNQKKMFGNSAKFLPYIECSTPDGKNQLPVCKEKNIKSYPTFEFSDGSRSEGELSLKQLSEKSGCVLPESK